MKVKCLLIGVVVLFVAGVLTTQSYAKLDPETIVGMWLFDEGDGDIAKDSSGNGNDGELKNDPEWVDSQFGKALSFDGADDYVDVGSDIIGTNAATICAWFYMNSWGGGTQGRIVDNGQFIFRPKQERSTIWFSGNLGAKEAVGAENAVKTDEWIHACATRTEDGTANVYINGELSSEADQDSGAPVAGTYNVLIGNRPDNTRQFNGLIDEVVIFNVVLTEDDVKSIMTGLSNILAVSASGKLTTTWATIKAR